MAHINNQPVVLFVVGSCVGISHALIYLRLSETWSKKYQKKLYSMKKAAVLGSGFHSPVEKFDAYKRISQETQHEIKKVDRRAWYASIVLNSTLLLGMTCIYVNIKNKLFY